MPGKDYPEGVERMKYEVKNNSGKTIENECAERVKKVREIISQNEEKFCFIFQVFIKDRCFNRTMTQLVAKFYDIAAMTEPAAGKRMS